MSQSQSFNFVSDPWIKVLKKDYNETEVSLIELFDNSSEYLQLSGDIKSQDLAILRLLLAILLSIYTRFDTDGNQYDWVDLDDEWRVIKIDEDDVKTIGRSLLKTWKTLYSQKNFSSKVAEYLEKYKSKFDLFGETPFYQVNATVYDQNVPENKQIVKGKGTVTVKQINRRISESNNTPSIFSPKTENEKNKINFAELARWLITYQNYTGVTDKTKVNAKNKFSVSPGWLYSINPVYIKGKDLFDTLMLNLNLADYDKNELETQLCQKPVWEYDDINEYIQQRLSGMFPDNLAELYTVWSRMLHIEWKNEQPTIFSAGLPKLDNKNIFLEPMTTWRKNKDNEEFPATRNKNRLNEAIWRNFGQYIKVKKEGNYRVPGIINWINKLKSEKILAKHDNVNVTTIAMISDGNATSQAPYAEVVDNMDAKADVLFDNAPDIARQWPTRIENEVLNTQKIATYFYWFAKEVSKLRGNDDKNSGWASKEVAQLYDKLNLPFYSWLASLKSNDDRDEKVQEWRDNLNKIVAIQAGNIFRDATANEIIGRDKDNIFTSYNKLRRNVYVSLK